MSTYLQAARGAASAEGAARLAGAVRDTLQTWWYAVRAAPRKTLVYEAVVAGGNAALAGVGGLVGEVGPWTAVLGAAACLVLLPLRRVYPLCTLVLAYVVPGNTSLMPVFMAVSAGYRSTRAWRTVLGFVLSFGVFLVTSLFAAWLRTETLLLTVGGFLLTMVMPAVVARLVAQRRSLVAVMQERNVQLHRQQAAVADQARALERTRIARDLHDSLGHRLTLVSLYTGALKELPEDQRDETVALLRSTSATAMEELRQILGVLHSAEADTASAQPLSSLDDMVESARAAGARIALTRAGEVRPLPPLIEHAAYRALQEGVTNALKHAAGAPIEVALRYESDALLAEVVNGPGGSIDDGAGGRGLIGLDERIRLAGGILHHGPAPDGGFRVAAMLPFTAPSTTRPPAPPEVVGDFPEAVRRSSRRTWTGVVIIGVVLVLVLAMCVAGTLLTVSNLGES